MMHELQKKILDLAKKQNIESLTLRQIGALVGSSGKPVHPQNIRHHINQLVKKGLLIIDEIKKTARAESSGRRKASLVSIPIVGAANCGAAKIIAEENIEGYLRVSPSLIRNKTAGICAIQAIGDSMNRASIGDSKRKIEDGDYVIVDYKDRSPGNNDYVLSIIDGAANIKKFVRDDENHQIILKSESTHNYPPIFIHENDSECYSVNGKIIQVIKNP